MNIISQYIDLCFLKSTPSDLPSSSSLLMISLIGYFILGVLVNQLDLNWNMAVFISLADVAVMLLVIKLLLGFRGFQSRYTQTVTALAGTGMCMSIIAYPILRQFYQIDPIKQTSSFLLILLVVLLMWNLMIVAQILRHSLEIKVSMAMIIAMIYMSITILVTGLVMSGVA